MLERIWSGWRSTYVSSIGSDLGDTPEEGSLFTRILRSDLSDDDANIVHRGDHCFVILNAYPYGTGHLLVLPYREIADLEDLTEAEAADLWATVTDGVRAVKAAYRNGILTVTVPNERFDEVKQLLDGRPLPNGRCAPADEAEPTR